MFEDRELTGAKTRAVVGELTGKPATEEEQQADWTVIVARNAMFWGSATLSCTGIFFLLRLIA